jgi:cytochrome c553
MTNNHFSTIFSVLVALAALALPTYAEEHVAERPAVATPGNAAEAQNILGAKLLVCNVCHGANGIPKMATIPIIWGLQESYLLKQLHDFQHGDRNSEVMKWMATALTQEELGPAAAYFAKKNWPGQPTSGASLPPAAVAVCQACHQQNLAGGVAAPRLAGQKYEYLVEAMRRFADGERTNSPDMRTIMQAISEADREAMARYISGL